MVRAFDAIGWGWGGRWLGARTTSTSRRAAGDRALALAAGGVLLAAGSLRVAAQLAPRSTASFLLGAYVVAWAQLVAGSGRCRSSAG